MALPTSPPSKWRNKNHRNFYFQRSSFGVGVVILGCQWLRDARLSLFPRWEYFTPTLGTSCSQCGNFLCNRDCCLIRHGYWMTEAGYWTIRAGYWKLSDGYCLFLKSLVNFHRVKLNYLSTSFTSYWKPCHSLLFLPKRLDSQEESWHKTFMWLFSGGAKLVINFLLCKFLSVFFP